MTRKSPAQLQREIDEALAGTSHATKRRIAWPAVVGSHDLGTADVRTEQGAYWIVTRPTGYSVDYKPWGPSGEVDLGMFPSRKRAREKIAEHALSVGATVRHHATKKQSANGSAWTTEHKASGATVIERHAFGSKLTVVPVNWSDPSGPANWSVTRGSSQQVGFDHKRGHAASVKGAKAAAMQAAKDMPRRGAGAVRSHAAKKPASAGGAQKLVAAAQKAHKGPWRTDLVVATIKKLWGSGAAANAKKIWLYFRDDAQDSLSARFWADIYLNKMGGTYY